MALAVLVKQYLDARDVPYDVRTHEPTATAAANARASSVAPDNVAKGVLIRGDDESYVLAIVPATHHVALDAIGKFLNKPVRLASQLEASTIFGDCEIGGVPPIGEPYDLMTVMDDSFEGFNDIYFEGGDHRTLVHVTGENFHKLMHGVPHAQIGVKDK